MELVHCIYCSAHTQGELSADELGALLQASRLNNGKIGVTGMLLYRDGAFFQVLEGEPHVVEALFEKIAKDKRHNRIIKIILEPIDERAFAEWTMGHAQVTEKDLAEIPGLNDFFVRGTSYLDLGEGRAKALLAAFKEGRWRLSLS